MLRNRNANPQVEYNDSLSLIAYGHNERTAPTTLERVNKANYQRIMQLYHERFSDATGFKMLLVGNVNIDSLRPLLCQYVASLPAAGRKEEMMQALKGHGFGTLVVETVNVNTLASFLKEQREATGEDIPAWLEGIVNTYDKVSVGIRKS